MQKKRIGRIPGAEHRFKDAHAAGAMPFLIPKLFCQAVEQNIVYRGAGAVRVGVNYSRMVKTGKCLRLCLKVYIQELFRNADIRLKLCDLQRRLIALGIASDKYPIEPVTSSPKIIAVDAGLSMESQDSLYFTP